MAHNLLTSYLTSEHSSTMVCTSAGVIGDITKAVVTPHLLNITFNGGCTVATYAALSSVAAYLAKEAIGWLHKKAILCLARWKEQKEVAGDE